MKKIILSLVASLTVGANAADIQVGDRLILKQSVPMAQPRALRVPEVSIRAGRVIPADSEPRYRCSLTPDGDQFETRFGDVQKYTSIVLSRKEFVVTSLHYSDGKPDYANLESVTGGKWSLDCAYYTSKTTVTMSVDKNVIREACGSICEVQDALPAGVLDGKLKAGLFGEGLEL